MKIGFAKGNSTLTWISIVVAAIVGMLTGTAVEGMPLANMLATSVLTGLVAGGVLFFIMKLLKQNKPG